MSIFTVSNDCICKFWANIMGIKENSNLFWICSMLIKSSRTVGFLWNLEHICIKEFELFIFLTEFLVWLAMLHSSKFQKLRFCAKFKFFVLPKFRAKSLKYSRLSVGKVRPTDSRPFLNLFNTKKRE